MRFFLASIFAVVVSVLLFELMFTLIHSESNQMIAPEMAMAVNIESVKELTQTQTQQQKQRPPEPKIEPALLAISSEISLPDVSLQDPDVAGEVTLEFTELELGRYQHNWVQPGAINNDGSANGTDYIGERDSGTKVMVPVATRQPLIPKVAWDNKINGWVLIAFTVNNQGHVENIRIMDASPRGVFEAHAVSAIEKWRYDAYKGPVKQFSQRIEFLYKNYPNNWGDF
ncbi:MAG: TonB family protein [Pseudomonadales bacterium]|nr:TonB family protein [Pseudomonadales bacterium]